MAKANNPKTRTARASFIAHDRTEFPRNAQAEEITGAAATVGL
jgi:hypothetical protein